MSRNLTVLLSVLVLGVSLNLPTAFSTVQPEMKLTKKQKKEVKKIAKQQGKKQAKKLDDKQHPVGTDGLDEGAIGTAQLEDDAVTKAKLAEGVAGFGLDCSEGLSEGDEMVRVGSFCIDKYEASVWSEPDGGMQYGVDEDDYPCKGNGQDCQAKIYARSVPGVKPSRFITWFQMQAALRNVGKRLPSNAEWQMAVQGTPDHPGPCNTDTGGPEPTGSRLGCISIDGAYDMVGNAWEAVADWLSYANACPGWGPAFDFTSDDWMCLSGASDTVKAPGITYRGGHWADDVGAGPFAVAGNVTAQGSSPNVGFRGVR